MAEKRSLGKESLLDAAATLVAEHGVEGVSLGDIHRASGHRNRSAVAYHFGGKDELMRALAERTVVTADRRRLELITALEAAGPEVPLRTALRAAVQPMGEALATEAGRQRLRLLGQLTGHSRFRSEIQRMTTLMEGLGRCVAHMLPHLGDLPAWVVEERISLVSAFALRSFADRALQTDRGELHEGSANPEVFTESVVDLLVAMATAPTTVADPTSPVDRTDASVARWAPGS